MLCGIVCDYPELQFAETLYQGAKLFPEDPYFEMPVNLHFFLTQPERPSQVQLCQRPVASVSDPTCQAASATSSSVTIFPVLYFPPASIPALFLGAEEWRGPVQHREVFGRSLDSEEEMGVGVVLRPYSVTSSTLQLSPCSFCQGCFLAQMLRFGKPSLLCVHTSAHMQSDTCHFA